MSFKVESLLTQVKIITYYSVNINDEEGHDHDVTWKINIAWIKHLLWAYWVMLMFN